MSFEDRLKRLGDVGGGIDVIELAGRHDGSEQRPVFSSDLMTGEEGILSCQSHGPDGVFYRVGVELEPAVMEEPGAAFPVSKGVADVR